MMEDLSTLPMLAGAGLTVAFLSGLVGIGGGALMVPLLLYMPALIGMAPFPEGSVAALGAIQIAASGLSGALAHRMSGNLDPRLWLRLVAGGAVGAAGGVWLSGQLATSAIRALFAVAVTAAAAVMIAGPQQESSTPGRRPGWATVATGGLIGGLIGLVGAGVFLVVPACIALLRTPIKTAVASALGFGLVVGSAVGLMRLVGSQVEPAWMAALAAGALVGAPLGERVGRGSDPKTLRRIFVSLVILVAIRLWWDVLS